MVDRVRYRQRNVVERCVNRLKQWRGIATRFDKRAANYRAAVVIASLLLWLDGCAANQALAARLPAEDGAPAEPPAP